MCNRIFCNNADSYMLRHQTLQSGSLTQHTAHSIHEHEESLPGSTLCMRKKLHWWCLLMEYKIKFQSMKSHCTVTLLKLTAYRKQSNIAILELFILLLWDYIYLLRNKLCVTFHTRPTFLTTLNDWIKRKSRNTFFQEWLCTDLQSNEANKAITFWQKGCSLV